MTVVRYNHYITYDDIPHMEEHTNGEYVKWVDYLRLQQELNYYKNPPSKSEELAIFKRAAQDYIRRIKRPEGGV